MIVMSTPVYESVRVAAAEGIPAVTGYPPNHPDIYGQLCSEFGHDPRTGEHLASRRGSHLHTSGTDRPRQPAHEASVRSGGRRRAGAHALPW
jgi:hypothetical protein